MTAVGMPGALEPSDMAGALPQRKFALSEAISESSEASNERAFFGEGGVETGVTTAAALDAMTASVRDASSSSSDSGAGSSGGAPPDPDAITAKIVATSNQLEDEPWLPVRNIVTMFRIQVNAGEKQWEVMRRYTDFSELHLRLSKAVEPSVLPPLPPKLMLNDVEDVATRYLELDAYLRKLLAKPPTSKHARLLDFLGAEKHGVRYGVRRFEYDSAQSEGNKYIRDDEL